MLLQEFGGLKLRLDQVLLQALPETVAGLGDLLDLLELILIAIEDRQRLRVIEQFVLELLDLFLDCTPGSFITMLGVLGVLLGFRLLQAELAGPRNILRDAEAGVVEVASLIARKWLRTSNREMLERDLRIGQRRGLDRHLRLSLPMAARREHDRTPGESLIDERSQSIGTGGCLNRRGAILSTSRRRNRTQSCDGKYGRC